MISEKRLAEIRGFFGSGGFGPIVNELLDEITALRKIAVAAEDAHLCHDSFQDESGDLQAALKQWRDGGKDD